MTIPSLALMGIGVIGEDEKLIQASNVWLLSSFHHKCLVELFLLLDRVIHVEVTRFENQVQMTSRRHFFQANRVLSHHPLRHGVDTTSRHRHKSADGLLHLLSLWLKLQDFPSRFSLY